MSDFFPGFDWSATPLGVPTTWPQNLRTLVALVLSSDQPMFVAWGAERTLLYNDAYAPLLGYKHPDALGRPFLEVWSEVRNQLDPLFDRVFNGDAIHMSDFHLSIDRGEGPTQAHFAFSYTPIRNDDGTVEGLFCACTETTEAVLVKVQRERERENLARMFEQGPSFIALLEGPDHRIELANASYLRLVGDRPLIGKTIAEALPDAVAQGYLDLLDDVFRTGKVFNATGAKYVPTGSSDERYLDFVYQPITDGAGAITGIFVEGADVTERTLAETSLRESEARLRDLNVTLERRIAERSAQLLDHEALIKTFFEHSSECHAVLVEIEEGVFKYEEVNPSTLRLYNKTRDQVVGLTVDEIFTPENAAELSGHLTACLRLDAPYHYERIQGQGVVEAIATPVPKEHGIGRRVVVTARDVTDRRRIEQQLRQSQKMEAVGQLTGGLAHDFNNLLTGITGSLEMLQTRAAQGRMRDSERYIAAAQGAAKRAATLTHRLLAFSRQQTLDPEVTDVNRLVADMEEFVQRTVGPEIAIEVVGTPGLWPVLVDRNQLENALLNLCINGRDAMPDGGKLTIETANKWLDERAARERDLSPGQFLSLCVSDTGTGMSPEVIARAFDPFFTTKPLGQGTGLGLSMIYGFARQSGGQVRIYSEIGRGSTICIYLPRHYGAAEDGQSVVDVTTVLPAEHGETVLVVDDEPTIRMLITDVLDDLGYHAIEAADGKSALSVLQSSTPIDLLITDIGLPGGLNGRQLADAACALRRGLKVLFITGYAENAAIGHGHLAAGMYVMTKPFALDKLAERIRDIISRGS